MHLKQRFYGCAAAYGKQSENKNSKPRLRVLTNVITSSALVCKISTTDILLDEFERLATALWNNCEICKDGEKHPIKLTLLY